MKMFIKLAWRNVLRNRRRSMVTMIAVSLGLGILIHYSAFTAGFKEQMTENSVRMYIMGHVLIHEKGFQDDMSAEKSIPRADQLMETIKKSPMYLHVRGMTSRVKFQALISSTANSYGVMAVGISPETESTVTTINKTVEKGQFLTDGQQDVRSIVIGQKLAKALKVDVGDKVVLMAQASDGSMGAEALRVKGIFRSSNPDLDRSVVYIPIRTAQQIMVYDDRVSEVASFLITRRRPKQCRQASTGNFRKTSKCCTGRSCLRSWSP